MPLYNYQCPECKTTCELKRAIKDRNRLPLCACGRKTTRVYVFSFSPQVWDSDKVYHNFDVYPTRFKTQDDMRRRCRQDGIECGQLL